MLAASVQADVRNRSGIRVILKMNSQAETAGTAANAAGIPQSRILGTIPKDNLVIAKLTWREIYIVQCPIQMLDRPTTIGPCRWAKP